MIKRSGLWLFSILTFYAALHIATSYQPRCDDDCEKVYRIEDKVKNNRPYVSYVERCTHQPHSDTICVVITDTITTVNWRQLADSTCYFANSEGLTGQKVFIIRRTNFPPDTLARVQCP
jgi:hypothetical protein